MQYNNFSNSQFSVRSRKGSLANSQFIFPNQSNNNQPQNSIKKSMIFPQKVITHQVSNVPSFIQNRQSQNVYKSVIFNSSPSQNHQVFQNPFLHAKQVRGSVEDQSKKYNQKPSFFKIQNKSSKQQSGNKVFFNKNIPSPQGIKYGQNPNQSIKLFKDSSQSNKQNDNINNNKQIYSPINPRRLFQYRNQRSTIITFQNKQSSDKQKEDQKTTMSISQKSSKVPQFLKKSSPINSNAKQINSQKSKISDSFILQKVSTQIGTEPESPSQQKKLSFQNKSSGFKNYVQTQSSFSKKKNLQLNSTSFAKISSTPQSNPIKGQFGNFEFGRLSSPSSLLNRRKVQSVYTKKQFSLQDFELVDKIGKGAFGDVFISRQKITGFLCVLKKVSKKKIKQLKLEESILRQIKIQSYLTHKHLTSLYGFFHDLQYLYLILQILPDGSMSQVKKKKKIPQKQVCKYVRQVCQGLRYMHKEEIIHRDIKPQNIFMNQEYLKIGDFGCAIYTNTLRKTLVGCLAYISPQQLNNEFYDDKIDVWSLGIFTYELLTGKAPFEQNIIKASSQQLDPSLLKIQFPQNIQISDICKDFIQKLLAFNPNDRMDIDEAVKHLFIVKGLQLQRKQQQQIFGVYQAL